ncbi:MAG TPA: hypothetical protein VFS05_04150 [Gemmatimonadaceae bacterium]|nr:hypothetical protein [Gemmatimonadaceae bacterium]
MEPGAILEELKQRLRDAMSRVSSSGEGRAALALMREAVVSAKVAVRELHEGVAGTRARLAAERQALETVRRRGQLAAGINDGETVRIAGEYERRHVERIAVLERKLEAQEAELQLAEREVEEMTRQLKSAAAGVTPAGGAGSASTAAPEVEVDLDAELKRSIDRGAREARAEEMLAELKRRMGR